MSHTSLSTTGSASVPSLVSLDAQHEWQTLYHHLLSIPKIQTLLTLQTLTKYLPPPQATQAMVQAYQSMFLTPKNKLGMYNLNVLVAAPGMMEVLRHFAWIVREVVVEAREVMGEIVRLAERALGLRRARVRCRTGKVREGSTTAGMRKSASTQMSEGSNSAIRADTTRIQDVESDTRVSADADHSVITKIENHTSSPNEQGDTYTIASGADQSGQEETSGSSTSAMLFREFGIHYRTEPDPGQNTNIASFDRSTPPRIRSNRLWKNDLDKIFLPEVADHEQHGSQPAASLGPIGRYRPRVDLRGP